MAVLRLKPRTFRPSLGFFPFSFATSLGPCSLGQLPLETTGCPSGWWETGRDITGVPWGREMPLELEASAWKGESWAGVKGQGRPKGEIQGETGRPRAQSTHERSRLPTAYSVPAFESTTLVWTRVQAGLPYCAGSGRLAHTRRQLGNTHPLGLVLTHLPGGPGSIQSLT